MTAVCLRALPAAVLFLALALAPSSASAQSAPGQEASDDGVIATCSLYYGDAPVDCSHLEGTRSKASATLESSIQPSDTVGSREDVYASQLARSALPATRLQATPLAGSTLSSSELTAVRSGVPEPSSSLYVEPFDPARTYTRP